MMKQEMKGLLELLGVVTRAIKEGKKFIFVVDEGERMDCFSNVRGEEKDMMVMNMKADAFRRAMEKEVGEEGIGLLRKIAEEMVNEDEY